MGPSPLDGIQLLGYVASLLVLLTFCMPTMLPLWCVAMGSNVAFFTYGYLAGLAPICVLHSVLLPINLLRLYQMHHRLASARRAATGEDAIAWLLPYMTQAQCKPADVLFRKDEAADTFYYLVSGAVRVPELGSTLGPGALLGDLGMVSPLQARTTSAVCETEVTVLVLSAHQILELYTQHPEVAVYLGQMIIRRLLQQLRQNSRQNHDQAK